MKIKQMILLLSSLLILLWIMVAPVDAGRYEFMEKDTLLSISGGCPSGECHDIEPLCDDGCTPMIVFRCSGTSTSCVNYIDEMACYCGPGHYVFIEGCY